ncbi:glycoside hydrolase/deacetylase [Jimgerdemannia flammicorona]|uniref:Glycoside hydrolase/deacetylase n=1 Tax=Jimgerdemannia flammicorona TaxID=994334 RepID=A0A433Q4U6_9FUNG|nr:glycoside hydrolase/deacetylase [Jimgerdemannia flammicorona]
MRSFAIIAISIVLIGSAKAAVPNATDTPSRTGQYPVWDQVPRTDDPQIVEWLKSVDLSQAPNIPLSKDGTCPKSFDPNICWWTCNGCTRPDDVVVCRKAKTWGLTYDDGPTRYTKYLLEHLNKKALTATFFIVGSRAAESPLVVAEEARLGHQLAVHTWSHHALTSLTNEQIAAELLWTSKAIFDASGLYPAYFRPPYGDIDDRVRYVAKAVGMTPVIWTSGYDTEDWQIGSNPKYTEKSIITTFTSWIPKILALKTGFITLEHDLSGSSVITATKLLPIAIAKGIKPMSVAKCVNGTPYRKSLLVHTGNSTVPSIASSTSFPSATASVNSTQSSGGPTVIPISTPTANSATRNALASGSSIALVVLAVVSYSLL